MKNKFLKTFFMILAAIFAAVVLISALIFILAAGIFLYSFNSYEPENPEGAIKKPLEQRIEECESINYFPFARGYALTQVDTIFGLIDKKGNFTVEPIYQHLSYSDPDLIRAQTLKDKWGFIDKNGNILIDTKYDFAEEFSEGLAAVKIGDKWGFINTGGELVIDAKYDGADSFEDNTAAVKISGKWGLIDKNGNIKVPAQFDYIQCTSHGYRLAIQNDSSEFLVNEKGDKIPFLGIGIDFCTGRGAVINNEGHYTYITPEDKIRKTGRYQSASPANEGYTAVSANNKWGLVDKNLNEVIKPGLIKQPVVSDGVFVYVDKNEKYGYMDTKGNIVIKAQYDFAKPFSDGLANVCTYNNGHKCYFIDKNNKIVFECHKNRQR